MVFLMQKIQSRVYYGRRDETWSLETRHWYFLQLVVKDLMDEKNFNLEEYVFQLYDKNGYLCYPMGLQWNRTVDVYLNRTANNLGRWVHHFIKNVEKIIRETKDEHLHVIIYDYDSSDNDLKQALQRSTLKN